MITLVSVLRHSLKTALLVVQNTIYVAPTIPTASVFGSDLAKVLVDITAVYYMPSSASEQEKKLPEVRKHSFKDNYMYVGRTIAYLTVFRPQVTSEKFNGFIYQLLKEKRQ